MRWGNEDRRVYLIDGLCVGLILKRYARNTAETADRVMMEQIQQLRA